MKPLKKTSSKKTTGPRPHATFYVNGVKQEVSGDDNFLMLANWLRRERELVGTKIVCAEGDCGACTVQQFYPGEPSAPGFQAVNSCIKLVGQMDGASIVTIEGIQAGDIPSPVQEAMKACHGSQCGYCTPGFVMAMSGVLEDKKQLNAKQAMNCLTGNLCRCTGYQPIIDAAVEAKYSDVHSLTTRYLTKEIRSDLTKSAKTSLQIIAGGKIFYAPVTLLEALTFLAKHKANRGLRIINSSTDLAVQYNKGRPIPDVILSLHLIPELQKLSQTATRITVGARVTLTTLRDTLETTHPEFAGLLNVFASPQIKNTATLVGNVANASPIGDTMPFLMVADGVVHTASLKGKAIMSRKIPLTEFYLGYKTLALRPGELITHVSFAAAHKNNIMKLYKVAARKDLDISAVCGAFSIALRKSKSSAIPEISEARIALGGVAATTIRCNATEKLMVGKPWTKATVDDAAMHLAKSIAPLDDLRGSSAYRHVLAKNMLLRFGNELLKTEHQGES